jgi:hypothetical protein
MQTRPKRLTIAQYAKHRRVSRAAVYKALNERRITREPDGTIDPVKADRMWQANTMPTLRWLRGGEDVVLTDADLDRLLG